MANLRAVEVVDEVVGRDLLDALDLFVEETAPRLIDDLRPAFAAQAEHVRGAIASLAKIAQRGRL